MKFIFFNVVNSKFPYSIDFYTDDVLTNGISTYEIYEWCTENFGPPAIIGQKVDGNEKWIKQYSGVRFREENNRNWFLMRWGE